MNNDEFIKRIKQQVHDAVVLELLDDLENPPGRQLSKSAKELSLWLNGLSKTDKNKLQKVVSHATHSAIFGILAVLDGVRAIEDEEEKGILKLIWEKDVTKILLNDPCSDSLHDIYQSEVYTEVFENET